MEEVVGRDAYLSCPDPNHVDVSPSMHVCLEDVVDAKGRSRLGWFNCWSHPGDGLWGDFINLVARVRGNVWDRRPTGEERDSAVRWLRASARPRVGPDLAALALRRRRAGRVDSRELVWPPTTPLRGAPQRFSSYLESRGVGAARAEALGVRAVERPGSIPSLRWTVPGVLFPILGVDGEAVNWFVRAVYRGCAKADRVRYGRGSIGVLWPMVEFDSSRPTVLVEGIFDRERTCGLVSELGLQSVNVQAVLGGSLSAPQVGILRPCPWVGVIPDGDAGGLALAESVRRHLGPGVRVATIPDGTDPGSAEVRDLAAALTSLASGGSGAPFAEVTGASRRVVRVRLTHIVRR